MFGYVTDSNSKMPLVSMKKTSGSSKSFPVRILTMDAELEFDVDVSLSRVTVFRRKKKPSYMDYLLPLVRWNKNSLNKKFNLPMS